MTVYPTHSHSLHRAAGRGDLVDRLLLSLAHAVESRTLRRMERRHRRHDHSGAHAELRRTAQALASSGILPR